MNNLTASQIAQLNNLNTNTQIMRFGEIIKEIIRNLGNTTIQGSPVNAVNASKVLTISGVVLHGEIVTINNPATAGTDVYEFLADTAQSKAAPTNIGINITAHTTKSTATLTVDTQPTSGDTMTIGEKEYTFVPIGTNTADGEVSIGADLAAAQVAIVEAINGIDGVNTPNPLVTAGNFAANASTITALIGGVSGDTITVSETFTAATNIFSGETLSGGADCTAANAVTSLVEAITASDTQGVGAADGAGDTVVLAADVAGVVGNSIEISETLTNGAFAEGAVVLSGGVNGTVGLVDEAYVDETYLYRCIADNTVSGKNWRRIALGEVY